VLEASGMEGGGTGFFAVHVLLFDGSGPLVDLVVMGGLGAWGWLHTVMWCMVLVINQ
jgi:hypothetical protein